MTRYKKAKGQCLIAHTNPYKDDSAILKQLPYMHRNRERDKKDDKAHARLGPRKADRAIGI